MSLQGASDKKSRQGNSRKVFFESYNMEDTEHNMYLHDQAHSRDGLDRLSNVFFGSLGPGGLYFHSLVWEHLDDDIWREHRIIKREEFDTGITAERWVSALHSFDPACGEAVIKIGEKLRRPADSMPPEGWSTRVVYSWRRWDLLRNKEIELLTVCEEPFDPYVP